MVDGHGLVLSLMAGALLPSGISLLVSAPLYAALAELQVRRAIPEIAEPPGTGDGKSPAEEPDKPPATDPAKPV